MLIENNYWTKHESFERQETEDNTPPHARTPPLSVHFKKYISSEYYGRSLLVIIYLSTIVLPILTPI